MPYFRQHANLYVFCINFRSEIYYNSDQNLYGWH